MTAFYLRWGALVVGATILVVLTYRNYEENLATMTPEQVLANSPTEEVRVKGLVRGGTLSGELEEGWASFDLAGEKDTLPVQYEGPPPENLRELKTLILIGKWNPPTRTFQAREIALVTNYGFVMGGYIVGLIPLALFLFFMGRKVCLLYDEIKQSTLYQSESDTHVDSR